MAKPNWKKAYRKVCKQYRQARCAYRDDAYDRDERGRQSCQRIAALERALALSHTSLRIALALLETERPAETEQPAAPASGARPVGKPLAIQQSANQSDALWCFSLTAEIDAAVRAEAARFGHVPVRFEQAQTEAAEAGPLSFLFIVAPNYEPAEVRAYLLNWFAAWSTVPAAPSAEAAAADAP